MKWSSKVSQLEKSITSSDLHEMFKYDEDTGNLFWKRPNPGCNNIAPGDRVGSPSSTGHLLVYIKNTSCLVHRVIYCMQTGSWPKYQIDHINGLRDDNRIHNLRDCTQMENQHNRSMNCNNTSGATGVYFLKKKLRWRATITVNNKLKFIGTFKTFDEAINARKEAEQRFGFSDRHGVPQ